MCVHCTIPARQASPFVKSHVSADGAPPHSSLLPGHTSLLTLEPRHSADSSDYLQQWQDTAALLLQQPGLNVEAVKLSRQLGALQLFVQQQQKHKEGAALGEDTTNNSSSSSSRDVGGSAAANIASKLQELGFKLRAQEAASAAADWQKLQQLAALLRLDSGSIQQTQPYASDKSSHSEIAVACDEVAGCCSNSIAGANSRSSSCCSAETPFCKPAATAADTGKATPLDATTTTASSSSSSSSGELQQVATEAPTAVQVQVAVGGMTCSMCAGAVEHVVKKVRHHHRSAV
jgi:hypothetical protein